MVPEPSGSPGRYRADVPYDEDEWAPVHSRRWLRVVGLVVVVAMVAPAVYVALTRLGVLG